MFKPFFLIVLLGLPFGVLAQSPPPLNPALAQNLPFEPLSIRTLTAQHEFQVEVARTSAQKTTGLMHRSYMADDRGMLFDFTPLNRVAMWMKFTYIPLDMLFIDGAGKVVGLAENAIPHDETPLAAEQPIAAVLELTAGSVERLGIRIGDQVNHPLFGRQP